MRNKKGQTNMQVGGLVIVAVAIIVGVIMLQASAQNIDKVVRTSSAANNSVGQLVNNTAVYIEEYKSCEDFILFNATGDVPIPTSNYTVTNNVINPSTGLPSVQVLPSWAAEGSTGYGGGTATHDGTCQELTYDSSSGGRSIAGVIILLFAIAIAVVALVPALRNYSWR